MEEKKKELPPFAAIAMDIGQTAEDTQRKYSMSHIDIFSSKDRLP